MRAWIRARVGPHRLSQQRDLAGVGLAQALDHLERGRLAGAVGPQDAERLALLDAERDAVDGDVVAVALGQAVDRDGSRPSRNRACDASAGRGRFGTSTLRRNSHTTSSRWLRADRSPP